MIMDEQRIIDLIKQYTSDTFQKRIGDTPTDALQLVNKKYVDGKTGKFGTVSSGAAGTPFPTGWSASKNSTGNYTITHNLGTTSYVVVATPVGNDTIHAVILSTGSNSFVVVTANNAGSDADCDFMFILAS